MSRRFPTVRPVLCAGAVFLSSLFAVQAQPAAAPDAAEPGMHRGHHGHGPSRPPELTLQAQAVSQVAQDTVTITLAVEQEAANQVEVGRKLTAALDAAMPVAKSSEAVTARAGAYRVWANTNRDGKVTGWRGRAEILIESKDFKAASEVAGKLADRMPVAGIAFSLSDEARAAEERRLLGQAAQAFRDRALAAASAFGFNGYQIRKLDLGGGGVSYVPMPRGMAMAAPEMAKADVPLEADTVTVSVQVNGTVYLQ